MWQAPTGEWTMWRVGRQRLAWRPASREAWQAPGYDYFRNRWKADSQGPEWVAALLATVVVWPWRLVTNRWPVIAYILNAFDGDGRQRRTRPMPRAEADALVRRWAEHIQRYGQPPR
jgi:hypothetical protein